MGGYESDSSTGSSSDDVALRGRGKPPTVHSHWHWNEKRDNPFKAADFKGKNADKIVRSSSYFVGHGENRRMVSHTYVCWRGKGLFEKLEKGLLAKQDRKHVSVDGQDYVTKEMGNKYEQIPFHPDLMVSSLRWLHPVPTMLFQPGHRICSRFSTTSWPA